MQRFEFKKYWTAFLGWQGWKTFARGCAKAWTAVIRWPDWKKLFCLPMAVLLPVFVLCMAGLIWVFSTGREAWVPAYFLYTLSAYSLTGLCVKFPSAIRGGKNWLARHPRIEKAMKNEKWKFVQGLYFEQFINFVYGFFKIISGVVYGSAWIGADGIYNTAQGLIQLFQILRRKKPGSLTQQWKSYRFCGILVLLMHLTLTGLVFQMVNLGRFEDHPGYMIFATAVFAFYKIINSFLDVARDRKHKHPIDSSVRMLNLSQAIFSLFSLQVSMLGTFGTGEAWEGWLNLASGSMTCLLVASMGIYMIRRGNREIRDLQEAEHGQ